MPTHPGSRPEKVWAEITSGDALGRGHQPALSWWLPPGSSLQHAYRLRTDDGFETGRVDSRAQSFVRLPVFDRSRRSAGAQVKVWTDLGESDWSDPVRLEADLLADEDWVARWIGIDEDPRPAPGSRPAYWLRTSFDVPPFSEARLYVTALGLYERRRRRTHPWLHPVPHARSVPGVRHHLTHAAGAARARRPAGRWVVPRPGRATARGGPIRRGGRPARAARGANAERLAGRGGQRSGLARRALPHHRGRPDRRPAGRPPAPRSGGARPGHRRHCIRWPAVASGRHARRRSRRRPVDRAAGPAGPADPAGDGTAGARPGRLRGGLRAERQRVGAVGADGAGGRPADTVPRRVARRRGGPDHGAPRRRPAHHRGAVAARPGRRGRLTRRRRRVRAAVHHARLPVRPRRGSSRAAGAGRHHGRRGALRPAQARLVRLQRRPRQPAPRGGGVVAALEHLRRPDRLPAARAGRLDRGLAGLRADGRLLVRCPRLHPQVAGGPVTRPARRRVRAEYVAVPACRRLRRTARRADRLRRVGRRRRVGSLGPLPGVRGRLAAGRDVERHDGLGPVRGGRRRGRAASGPGRGATRTRRARAVPVGYRLSLGRVDGARSGRHRLSRIRAGRQIRDGHGLPVPLGGDRRAGRGRARAA